MKKIFNKTLLYTLLVAGIIAFLISTMLGVFSKDTSKEVFRVLSDSTFVSGAIFAGFGIIALMSRDGVYDALSYSMSRTVQAFGIGKKNEQNSFFEYKQNKEEKRKEGKSYNMLLSGLFWVAIGILFSILFNVA